MTASLSMPPRDKCPGCCSAIYDGAREQGWCTDCLPPEIATLRRQLSRRRFSAVIADAVAAALGAVDDAQDFDTDSLKAEQWFAMYQAQCHGTDELAKRADAKSDKALLARIADLEEQTAKLNRRISLINDAHSFAQSAARP